MHAPARLDLTARDTAILAMVFAYGGVGIAHIQARFWPTAGARSACYARVARLVEASYLGAQRLPAASGVGSGPLFLTVGAKARPDLARLWSCSAAALQRTTRMHVPQQLAHHLATCNLRLALELAVAASALVTAQEWTSEWELRRTPVKVNDPQTGGSIILVPDGAFTLTLADGSEQAFLVEMDMASMTEFRRMRARLRGYLVAARERALPILFVTTTRTRAATLARLAREEAARLGADATIFWLAQQDAVTQETVLARPIWQVVGGPEMHTLLPTAAQPAACTPSAPARAREGGRRDHALAELR